MGKPLEAILMLVLAGVAEYEGPFHIISSSMLRTSIIVCYPEDLDDSSNLVLLRQEGSIVLGTFFARLLLTGIPQSINPANSNDGPVYYGCCNTRSTGASICSRRVRLQWPAHE